MTGADTDVIWANLVCCLVAVGANLWASTRRGGWSEWRPLRLAVALLAVVYATGYTLLLAGTVDLRSWSAFYRGVSPVAWLVVWAGPAVWSSHAWHRFSSGLSDHVREEMDRVRHGDDS